MADIDRRTVLKGTAAAAGVAAAGIGGYQFLSRAGREHSARRPNILVIIVDQMRSPQWFPDAKRLGELLPNLDLASRPEIERDTVVVFTSDHGEYAGSHGLRGKGAAIYEESIRVPLYIHDPAGHLTPNPASAGVSSPPASTSHRCCSPSPRAATAGDRTAATTTYRRAATSPPSRPTPVRWAARGWPTRPTTCPSKRWRR